MAVEIERGTSLSAGNGCPSTKGSDFALPWRPVEDLEVRRDERPGRAALGEDGEGRVEGRGIVERAGVERVRVGLADLPAEHEAHALGAAVADRVAAIRRFRMELPGFAGEAHGLRLEAHERNEARARRPAAVAAIAMAGADRLAESLVAQGPAEAAASITLGVAGHRVARWAAIVMAVPRL